MKVVESSPESAPTCVTPPLENTNTKNEDKVDSARATTVELKSISAPDSTPAPFSDLSAFSSTPGFGDLKASVDSGASVFGKTTPGKFAGQY